MGRVDYPHPVSAVLNCHSRTVFRPIFLRGLSRIWLTIHPLLGRLPCVRYPSPPIFLKSSAAPARVASESFATSSAHANQSKIVFPLTTKSPSIGPDLIATMNSRSSWAARQSAVKSRSFCRRCNASLARRSFSARCAAAWRRSSSSCCISRCQAFRIWAPSKNRSSRAGTCS
jgi:hypothetical protein